MVLVAIGLLMATAPLGAMGLRMLQATTDRVLQERLVMTQAVVGHLDDRLQQGQRQLLTLAAMIARDWEAGRLDEVEHTLQLVAPKMWMFSHGVFLVDTTGRVVLAEPPGLEAARTGAERYATLLETLRTGQPTISGLLYTEAGSIPIVVFAVRVRAGDGPVLGAAVGILDLTQPTLSAFVGQLRLGRTGHAAIVDHSGTVLASTDPRELFTRNEHPEVFASLIERRKAVVGPVEEAGGPHGAIHVMAFAPLSVAPWGLGIGQSEEETFGPLRRLRNRIAFFGLAVLVIALLFAWWDTGAVIGPVRRLREAAEAIAAGHLDRSIEVRRADEIGDLARSFETMRGHLQASLEEIRLRAQASQGLYEVGRDVLALQDRRAVFQSIVGRAATLLRADAALLCLVGDGDRRATVAAAAGAPDAVAPDRSDDARADGGVGDPALDCPCLAAPYRAAHLSAPLKTREVVVGALCVGSRTPREFAPLEREVAIGLATLAAIALENARLQEGLQTLAVQEERERIAREIHDGVGQVLGYVNAKVQAISEMLAARKLEEARAQLAQLDQAARDVYADTREAILGLRTSTAPERHLVPALEEYLRHFAEQTGIATSLDVEGETSRYLFPPLVELQLIRIIQEALTNVRKHAAASSVRVRFTGDDGQVHIAVEDDGIGFDRDRLDAGTRPRFGMQTMHERAEAIGGALRVVTAPGRGTQVVVLLPAGSGRTGHADRPG